MLTSCPSCLQGLKRFNEDADLDADYIVVEILHRDVHQLDAYAASHLREILSGDSDPPGPALDQKSAAPREATETFTEEGCQAGVARGLNIASMSCVTT